MIRHIFLKCLISRQIALTFKRTSLFHSICHREILVGFVSRSQREEVEVGADARPTITEPAPDRVLACEIDEPCAANGGSNSTTTSN